MENDCVIVLQSNSRYKDICNIFLALFKKYWRNCDYKMFVSIAGDETILGGVNTVYNGKNATLPTCIYNVAIKNNAQYYVCFLGDAFINGKIDEAQFKNLVQIMREKNINYCSLTPLKPHRKQKSFNDVARYIHTKDRYSHNYVAFIASKEFILEEFSQNISDFDFEMKYLKLANQKCIEEYMRDRIILKKNYFNLIHGITKGKWSRHAYYRLKKSNPEINFDIYPVESFKDTVLRDIRAVVEPVIPNGIRKGIKRILKKLGLQFVTYE